MNTLELYTNELLVLKDILESDIELSGRGDEIFVDVELMQLYLDRAKVYQKVMQELGA